MPDEKAASPGDERRGDDRALYARRRQRSDARDNEAGAKAAAQEEDRNPVRAPEEADEAIDLDGPKYDALVATLKILPAPDQQHAREDESVLVNPERADVDDVEAYREKKGYEGAAVENLETSRDEAPFPLTDSRQWRRKTRRRIMNIFFVFEGEYNSE